MPHHMYRAYGGWTLAFKGYLDLNITMYLDDPTLEQLAATVDPYGELQIILKGIMAAWRKRKKRERQ